MPRVELQLSTSTSLGRQEANPTRTINWIPRSNSVGAQSRTMLVPSPGLKSIGSIGPGPCRGDGVVFKGSAYFVIGKYLAKVSPQMNVSVVGQLATELGNVTMASSGKHLMIVDGRFGYVYDGVGLTQLTQATHGFEPTRPTHVVCVDFYFLVNDAGTDKIYWSQLDNALAWSEADYTVAEARPDSIRAVGAALGGPVFFGETTTEVYYHSSDIDFVFEPVANGTIGVGIIAPYSLVTTDDMHIFLGQTASGGASVVAITSGQIKFLSTPEVDYALARSRDIYSTEAFAYRQEGALYYALSFIDDAGTWRTLVVDVSTGVWHERASHGSNRWRAKGHVFFAGKNIVGDAYNGKVYVLDPETYTDDGAPIRRVKRFLGIDSQVMITYNRLTLRFRKAPGLDYDPLVVLRWSDDGGYSWEEYIGAGIGARGDTRAEAEFYALGAARSRIFEVASAEPCDLTLMAAIADVESDVD